MENLKETSTDGVNVCRFNYFIHSRHILISAPGDFNIQLYCKNKTNKKKKNMQADVAVSDGCKKKKKNIKKSFVNNS